MKHTDRNHYGNKFRKVYKNAIDVALLDLEAAIKYPRALTIIQINMLFFRTGCKLLVHTRTSEL